MMFHSTALLFANGIYSLSSIVAERGEAKNESIDSLPPALPHDLLKLRPFAFS